MEDRWAKSSKLFWYEEEICLQDQYYIWEKILAPTWWEYLVEPFSAFQTRNVIIKLERRDPVPQEKRRCSFVWKGVKYIWHAWYEYCLKPEVLSAAPDRVFGILKLEIYFLRENLRKVATNFWASAGVSCSYIKWAKMEQFCMNGPLAFKFPDKLDNIKYWGTRTMEMWLWQMIKGR